MNYWRYLTLLKKPSRLPEHAKEKGEKLMGKLDLNVKAAYDFYKRFILSYTKDKEAIYREYGFTVQGSVGSKDWEVFAAILLNDRARPGNGADLQRHEVKSANIGGSYEYQYHRNNGLEKLRDDKEVDHVFIARSEDYTNVGVWWVDRKDLIPVFNGWEPELTENYITENRQRFRRSVTHSYVARRGAKLMEVREGDLVFSI